MAGILLIEPDAVLARTYAKTLSDNGHSVHAVATAQAAVLKADQTSPDIVIAELQLVEHSGIEFIYEFRSYADWQTTPLIIHSSVPQNEFAGSMDLLRQELGVAAYLYKPQTSLADLLNTVETELAALPR